MPNYSLELELFSVLNATTSDFEIWVDGVQLGGGYSISADGTSISIPSIAYGGALPTSLEFRFDDAAPGSVDQIEVRSVKINDRYVNTGNYLSTSTLNDGGNATVDIAGADFIFDSSDPDGSNFTPVTTVLTAATDTFRNYDGTDHVLDGLAGHDRIYLGDGDDSVTGGAGNDILFGGGGNDLLYGAGDNDKLRGQDGDDRLYGGAGNDRIHGDDGNDEIHGGDGDDRLNGNDGDDIITGGAGADKLNGGNGIDYLFGDDGDDQLTGGAGDDTIDGGAGDDIAYGGGGVDHIDGGDGNDIIIGDTGDDVLNGNDGDDIILGLADNDDIYGGNGADLLSGGEGNDTVTGGAGDDFIFGDGSDVVVSLAAYYKLDETSGTTVKDYSGNNRDGTYNGGTPTWNPTGGQIGGALQMPAAASDDAVEVGTWDVSGSGITISSWINQDTITQDARIISKTDNTSAANHDWALIIDDNASGAEDRIRFRLRTVNGFQEHTLEGVDMSDYLGSWTHVAVTYDDTTDLITYYINGVSVGTDTHGPGGAVITGSGKTIAIGNNPVGVAGTRQFEGSLDEVRVYEKGLSGGEITNLYNFYQPTGTGADILNGSAGDDVIYGYGGDDVINGGDDDDSLHGMDGVDTIDGGEGNDSIYGGDGDDDLSGSNGNDDLFGGDGDDTLNGGGGADYMDGGAGDDILNGGNVGDVIIGGLGNDTVNGGNGGDTLYAFDDTVHTQGDSLNAVNEIIFQENFSSGTGAFSYSDGGFGGSDGGNVSVTGNRITSDGAATASGALRVYVDGQNNNSFTNGSGSWDASYTATSNLTNVQMTFSYRHIHANANDTGEDSQVWFEFDGVTYNASGASSFLSEAYGAAGTTDTGWVTVTIDLPDLTSGNTYNLSMGILHLGSSRNNEDAEVRFDDILMTAGTSYGSVDATAGDADAGSVNTVNGGAGNDTLYGSAGVNFLYGGDDDDTIYSGTVADEIIFSDTITGSAGSYSYADGVFGSAGSSNSYASGSYEGADGSDANGSLEILLGGIDNNNINDMSGAWQRSFTLTEAKDDLVLTFDYRFFDSLADGDPFDNNEDLQLYADINGTTYSNDANPYFFELLGSDAYNAYDSGWLTVSLNVGSLAAGTHTLSLGGLLTRKTWASEEYTLRFDDVSLVNASVNNVNTLSGEDGLDTLYGSSGRDVFLFEAASAYNDLDVIENFGYTLDAIDLSDLLTGYNAATDDINDFVQLTEGGGNTTIAVDANGTAGGSSFSNVAVVNGVTGMDLDVMAVDGTLIF